MVASWFAKPTAGNIKVLDRVAISPKDRIANIVGQILARRAIVRPAQDDDDLSEMGISSLDMVNLMLAVEEEFNIKIPDNAMTPSNFRSIARIDALVTVLFTANGRSQAPESLNDGPLPG